MKSLRRFLAFASAALLMIFFMALPVLAAEGAEPDPADTTAGLIFRWLNFLIVFGGIAYLIAKHGGAFFRGNAKEIAASIVEATAAKAEAERELHEVETKIAQLDRMWRKYARKPGGIGPRNPNGCTLRAKPKSKRSVKRPGEELAASERAAQQQVREIAASMAVERAAALVSSMMNAEIRARMFQSFLSELGRGAN